MCGGRGKEGKTVSKRRKTHPGNIEKHVKPTEVAQIGIGVPCIYHPQMTTLLQELEI